MLAACLQAACILNKPHTLRVCISAWLQAVAYEYNGAFSTVLAQRMTYFNSDPGADVIDRVRGEISQVCAWFSRVAGPEGLGASVSLWECTAQECVTYLNSDPGADVIDRVRGEISQVTAA